MKKRWIIIGAMAIWLLTINIVYSFGYDAGENSSNLDEVYESYLNSILPENENGFSYIFIEDGSFRVGHNVTEHEVKQLEENYVFVFPLWTTQRFNDMAIFHLPRGGVTYG